MSGFHPVLGLLAVAVCISYAEGAPFSVDQNDDISAHQQQNQDFHISAVIARDDGPLTSALNNKNNKVANREDTQNTNVINERNYESINQAAHFEKFAVLRSKGQDAVITKAEARKSDSVRVGDDPVEGNEVLNEEERSDPLEDDCEEEEESNGESTITNTPTTTNTESEPTEPEEECDSSESSASTSQGAESPQTEDSVHTIHTETPQRTTKKPRDPNRSSGSFHESDSEGVDFSDSVSRESFGRSTEFLF